MIDARLTLILHQKIEEPKIFSFKQFDIICLFVDNNVWQVALFVLNNSKLLIINLPETIPGMQIGFLWQS